MAEASIPQVLYRTCEICGEETPAGATGEPLWAEAPGGRRIHAGPCFLEFGIIENTLAGSAIREAVQHLCELHRERARVLKAVAEQGRAHNQVLEVERDRAVGSEILLGRCLRVLDPPIWGAVGLTQRQVKTVDGLVADLRKLLRCR